MSTQSQRGAQATPGWHQESYAPRIIIVIPVYNHAGTLRDVVTRCIKVHDRVMVVDDGSSDGGADNLEGLDVDIIRHPKNLGKGVAILSAAKKALRSGMTHMVTVDADGQHDPDDFRRFIPELEAHPDAIIIGKRDFHGVYVPESSRVGRAISNFWLLAETGRSLGDAQSGFRAYPIALFKHLNLRERRYSFEIEVLVKAAWAGIELREVDISIHYPSPAERVSHFHLFWDNLRLSLLNTRLIMRAVIPLPHRKIEDIKGGKGKF